MEELEEIEEELLAESEGFPLQQEDDYLVGLASVAVCPLCQTGQMREGKACQVTRLLD